LPVVLYGCETWSLKLRDEGTLQIFENRMLWRIFGPKEDKIMGGWRKLHNEELRHIYPSQNTIRIMKSRRIKWVGHIARTVANRIAYAYRILVGKQEGERPLGRSRRR
jgi:hypothetical protein